MKNFKLQITNYKKITTVVMGFLLITGFLIFPIVTLAQNNQADPTAAFSDPTKKTFKLVACDGPAGANFTKDEKYIPCDFNGIMIQIQHLINVMMIIGVFAAIAAFSWAGFLYMTGNPNKIKQAHEIFPKVFFGFIIMLSAWFIVYQILDWLTDNPGFKTLLGNP